MNNWGVLGPALKGYRLNCWRSLILRHHHNNTIKWAMLPSPISQRGKPRLEEKATLMIIVAELGFEPGHCILNADHTHTHTHPGVGGKPLPLFLKLRIPISKTNDLRK